MEALVLGNSGFNAPECVVDVRDMWNRTRSYSIYRYMHILTYSYPVVIYVILLLECAIPSSPPSYAHHIFLYRDKILTLRKNMDGHDV